MARGPVLGTLSHRYYTSAEVDRLELVGTLGTLRLSVFGKEPLELQLGEREERIVTEQPAHVQQPLLQSIVEELAGGEGRCSSTGLSALRASVVMDRVLNAYYGGRDDAFWARPESWPGSVDRALLPGSG